MERKSKGSALLLVILIFAIFTVLSALFAKIVYNYHVTASAVLEREQAFYLAEAGIERAIALLPNTDVNGTWFTLGNGKYKVDLDVKILL